jgi:hypothetical protein
VDSPEPLVDFPFFLEYFLLNIFGFMLSNSISFTTTKKERLFVNPKIRQDRYAFFARGCAFTASFAHARMPPYETYNTFNLVMFDAINCPLLIQQFPSRANSGLEKHKTTCGFLFELIPINSCLERRSSARGRQFGEMRNYHFRTEVVTHSAPGNGEALNRTSCICPPLCDGHYNDHPGFGSHFA